jgi:hypothetical protein
MRAKPNSVDAVDQAPFQRLEYANIDLNRAVCAQSRAFSLAFAFA